MTAKRYYTFMLEPELIEALKTVKERTGLSEGALLRQALRELIAKHDVKVKSGRSPVERRKKRP